MSIQIAFGSGLLRALVAFGFLASLVAVGTHSVQARANESVIVATEAAINPGGTAPVFHVTYQGDTLCFNASDLQLTGQMEFVVSDEFGTFEDDDWIEMFRVDRHRRIFGRDRAVTGPKVVSTAARNSHPNICPPLLV